MVAPWTLAEPLIVDRSAERRGLDMAHADAIIVRDGTVLAAEGRLVEIPADARPEASLVVYLGADQGRDLVAVVPADEGYGGDGMLGLRDLLQIISERGDDGAR